MKKILFILGLASLLVTGCGDFFDTAPSNKIPTAIAFRTVTDVSRTSSRFVTYSRPICSD